MGKNLLEWIFQYYSIVCFNPLRKNSKKKPHLVKFLLPLYILSRALGLINVTYDVLFIQGAFTWKHGPLTGMGKLEAGFYLLCQTLYLSLDCFLLDAEFLENLEEGFKILKYGTNLIYTRRSSSKRSANFKCWRCIIFSG